MRSRRLFQGTIVSALIAGGLTGCTTMGSATACDPVDPEVGLGWYAASTDSFLVSPSARGGVMLVQPADERVRHIVADDSGRFQVAGERSVSIDRARSGCEVVGLVIRDDDVTTYQRIEGPYSVQETHFTSADGTPLAGIALVPSDPDAGVVMVHGSGDSDRDQGAYLHIADHLARSGIGVLLPDKRGAGESGGDWRDADFEDLANDALAGIDALRTITGRRDLPAGPLGISQAGWIVPEVLQSPEVAFGVSLVGPAVTMEEQQRFTIENVLTAAGVPRSGRERALQLVHLATRYMRTGDHWSAYRALRDSLTSGPLASIVSQFPPDRDNWMWRWGRDVYFVDPLPLWRSAQVPGLVILGADDPYVPSAASAERLADVPGINVLVMEEKGHNLSGPDGGMDPVVLDRVTDWIRTVARTDAGRRGGLARDPRALDTHQWRADLEQIDREVRSIHPRPFSQVEEADYAEALEALRDEIPTLDDQEVMLRMAEIVGMLDDGHTRLQLPRSPGGLAFSYSHSEDPPPSDPRLYFKQLPVSLTALPDGLYVERTVDGGSSQPGSRVVSIGGVDAEEILARAERLVSAENEGGHRLNAADLLEIPEVVEFVGGEPDDCGIPAQIEYQGSLATVCWSALSAEATVSPVRDLPPYRTRADTARGLVVFELNEITTVADPGLGEAVTEAVRAAEEAGAPLVLDLRQNTGGNNSYARVVTLAVVASPAVNSFGRFFALIGPRTFSAAQSLLNELERFTHVLFVGEPSGARADHFGDARRVRLANSGLTLRVATLHWSSGTANDQRTATRPHVPAPPTPLTEFGPGDAALDAVEDYRYPGLAGLIESQLRQRAVYNAANAGVLDAAKHGPELAVEDYLAMARRLVNDGDDLGSAYALQIGLFVYPYSDRLTEAFREARDRVRG